MSPFICKLTEMGVKADGDRPCRFLATVAVVPVGGVNKTEALRVLERAEIEVGELSDVGD